MANNGKKTSSKQIEEPTITDVQEVAVDSEEKKPVRKRKITKKSIEPIIEEKPKLHHQLVSVNYLYYDCF